MAARWLLNLLLLLVVVGLAALAYVRPGLDEPATPEMLSSQLPEQAQRLEIERPGRDVLTMERTVGGWQLTSPIKLPANHFRIEPLLQLRRAMSHSSFPVVADALAQYGLAQPEVWLTIDGERYAFGGVEPLNSYRYVMFGGRVHLLSDRIHHYLRMSPYDFVSLRLLPAQRSVKEMRIGARAVRDELLLGLWQEVAARRVSAYPEPEQGVEQIELVLDDETSLTVDILQREPEVVFGVRERAVSYHFRIDDGERLLPTMESGVEADDA